ncbi:MAG: hypothetical protein ABF288_08455 [Octadecabacter sp.]
MPDHGEMRGDTGCVLLAQRDTRLVWTNCLGPKFTVTTIGDGPIDFGCTTDIQLAKTATVCDDTATVHHATPDAARAHENMGFYTGWGTAADQLGAVAANL